MRFVARGLRSTGGEIEPEREREKEKEEEDKRRCSLHVRLICASRFYRFISQMKAVVALAAITLLAAAASVSAHTADPEVVTIQWYGVVSTIQCQLTNTVLFSSPQSFFRMYQSTLVDFPLSHPSPLS